MTIGQAGWGGMECAARVERPMSRGPRPTATAHAGSNPADDMGNPLEVDWRGRPEVSSGESVSPFVKGRFIHRFHRLKVNPEPGLKSRMFYSRMALAPDFLTPYAADGLALNELSTNERLRAAGLE